MFSFFGGFKYKTEVIVDLMTFLMLYPGGKKQLVAHYPFIDAAIKQFYKSKTKPFSAAAVIAANVLSDLALKIPEDDRWRVLEELRSMNMNHFEKLLHRHTVEVQAGKDPNPLLDPSYMYGTNIFAAAISIAQLMMRQNQITKEEAELIEREIVGTLQGLSASDRSTLRIGRALDELMEGGSS
jgi:hypothetical protein